MASDPAGYKGGIIAGLLIVAAGGLWFIPATHINAMVHEGRVSPTTAFVAFLARGAGLAVGGLRVSELLLHGDHGRRNPAQTDGARCRPVRHVPRVHRAGMLLRHCGFLRLQLAPIQQGGVAAGGEIAQFARVDLASIQIVTAW
jgi:hypothetical protein